DVAGDRTQSRGGRASEEDRAAWSAGKVGPCFCEGRVRITRQISAECALPYDVDQDVDNRRNDKREIGGAWNSARRILHFTTRSQCHLDSDESKNQKNNGIA